MIPLVHDRGYASGVPRLSKGEINRLGDRIRSNGGLADGADRELLERVLTEHLEVLSRARDHRRRSIPKAGGPNAATEERQDAC
jgi:hypothetical protein